MFPYELHILTYGVHKLCHVEHFVCILSGSHFQSRKIQHVVDELCHLPALSPDHLQGFFIFFDRPFLLQCIFALCRNDCHRRSQLMGNVGGKLALLFKRLLQMVKHLVKGRSQLMEFIIALAQIDPALQVVAIADLPGCPRNLLDGI